MYSVPFNSTKLELDNAFKGLICHGNLHRYHELCLPVTIEKMKGSFSEKGIKAPLFILLRIVTKVIFKNPQTEANEPKILIGIQS